MVVGHGDWIVIAADSREDNTGYRDDYEQDNSCLLQMRYFHLARALQPMPGHRRGFVAGL